MSSVSRPNEVRPDDARHDALEHDVQEVLAGIPDPEMPISIVDLGLVEHVSVQRGHAASDDGAAAARASASPESPASDGPVVAVVRLVPTFVGCPALEMIERDARDQIAALDGIDEADVRFVFDPPWTVDRISIDGRVQLARHGITVPEHGSKLPVPGHDGIVPLRASAIQCPYCNSRETRLDSPFGPTRCRMIWYCDACRSQFEHMKKI